MPFRNTISTLIPYGFCHCGCGRKTDIATGNNARLRWKKGQPKRYIANHQHLVNGRSNLDWLVDAVRNHNSNSCLLWPFFTNPAGYGQVFFQGKLELSHRVAFFISNKRWPIPHGCHECDVPNCVNPSHVFEGTNQDNIEDSCKKLRRGRVFTPGIVTAIRREYIPKHPRFNMYVLAEKYGTSAQSIFDLVARRTWKYL